MTGLDVLPLGRVINDAKVTDHHAIIPTNAEHRLDKLSDDDRRVYDLVVRRFLAVFHPDAVFENTRLETAGRRARVPHLAGACWSRPAGAASTARSRWTRGVPLGR